MNKHIVNVIMYAVSIPVMIIMFPIALLAFLLVFFKATKVSDQLINIMMKIANICGGVLDSFESKLRLS